MPTVMLNEDDHRKLKNMAKQYQRVQPGFTMAALLSRLIETVNLRVQMAFNDKTIPIPEGVGVPIFPIFMGLTMVDHGIMSNEEFQFLIKNFEQTGDAFLIAFDKSPEDARAWLDKINFVNNSK